MIQRAHRFFERLGPGLITGAADDDPSGIATYSQAGAQFGLGMLWSVLLTTPLMIGIQVVSARIGRVTGHGIARNIRDHYSRTLLVFIVSLLLVANTLNIAADLGAMGEALQLVTGGPSHGYALAFGVFVVLLQLFIPYRRLAPLLKWLTLFLFAYVAVLFTVRIPWGQLIAATILPPVKLTREYLMLLVGVLGTTISPYLFFWQASQEVEEQRMVAGEMPLREATEGARRHLRRIKFDTWLGMVFSNAIAFAIMLTTAVTLHDAGITNIETSAQAAQALRPLAGDLAFTLFAAGIIGTGLLAVPVLAGSAAYAVAEAMEWPIGHGLQPMEAKGFYGIIILATLLGAGIDFTSVDPIKALIWSAVLNGIVAVPIMVVMMRMAVRTEIMGAFVIKRRLKRLGWIATALMAITVVAMVGSFVL
ncbi:MAG: Nramp family divalent metal transporter [Betaproteobacteria bacterium]|nr:Nramp family divalent metal transporter [Betaproteobacteria bacterium]MDE2004270.1 Nramp family divalent metal transporter [Betaproteobacteria bacterium]MDE2209080.1 Nramp family divalent metal transporter [Betaproteobacteria bacterium]MDE2357942.1 Nramp family divalent metal transporter [Betaproteobacteria bacterium]